MKYVRFKAGEKVQYGIVEGEQIAVLDQSFLAEGSTQTGESIPLESAELLAPVQPSKIVCVGLNYAKHIEEMGHTMHEDPVIFLKPSTTVIGPNQEIVLPKMSNRVEYEAELAVVIGKTMKDVPEEKVFEYIFGYTCGNDVTARDLQRKDGQWTRGKGFDTFCPLGPWIVTGIDPSQLDVRSMLNGEIRQSSNTKYFMSSIPKLLSFISQVMTLYPGDVVMTGTPEGVGPMKSGDEIVVQIEGIGELRNIVK